MSILYVIVLCVVFIAFIAVTVEAVLSVSRPTPWPVFGTRLSVVETTERRTQDLRYLGPERRADHIAAQEEATADVRSAA